MEQSNVLAGEGCVSQNCVKIMEIYEWGTRGVTDAPDHKEMACLRVEPHSHSLRSFIPFLPTPSK